MSIDVANLNYVPTLALRSSEMNGLERLPGATKDNIQPVFLLAPWPNALELMRSVDRIQKAIGARPFFLDVDRDYTITNEESPAQQQWLDLQDPSNNYSNWVGFIESIPHCSPCLQISGLSREQAIDQVVSFQEMERTFALRIELNRMPPNLDDVIAGVNEVGSADFAIMLDAGWIEDTLVTRATLANIIRDRLGMLDANVPIVVSYTTIPKGFAEIEGSEFASFDNRAAIAELRQLTNRQTIVYGDWASTRPRERGIASRPKPRVDLPLRNGWLSARNKEEDWGFDDAALEVMGSDRWSEIDGSGIWGEYMIRQTAINPAVGINSPQKNVASRVNIHLHLQAFYDNDNLQALNLDEQWED